MKRIFLGVYAAFAYVLFLTTIVWAIGFLANFGVPKTIDVGRRQDWISALVVDGSLLVVFAAQHSVMARQSFKQLWGRIVPKVAERSTYVLLASAILLLLFWQWRPLPAIVWQVDWAPALAVVTALYVVGWLIVISATFMIHHFDMFGLRQAYLFAKARDYTPVGFKESWLYAWMRHPMMLGLLIAFWSTPRMSVGHLVFAGASTAYIFLGTILEERDLRRFLGATYRDYAARVPAFISIVPRHPTARWKST